MEFRKIFDTIPEEFDKYRPRYSKELFDALIDYAKIGEGKAVLEIGPGTGQATDEAEVLNRMPDFAPIPFPTIIATGVASPSAHGQLITRTETARAIA